MHPIVTLVGQRLALGALLLLAVSALIFIGVEMLPGDVAQAILGQSATETSLRNLREEMGLDQPALTRYFGWLWGILHGDLGVALTNKQNIATEIGERLGNTLFLAFWAAIVAVPLARPDDLRRHAGDDFAAGIRGRLHPDVSPDREIPGLLADLHDL